jgi:hypothetical protein
METAGLPDSIQVTRTVYDLLKDRFAFEPRGAIEIKGKGEVEAWSCGSEPNLTLPVQLLRLGWAMRASRLLSILLMLQTRGRLTAESLAASFEVSVRTVYRDIEQLSAAACRSMPIAGPGRLASSCSTDSHQADRPDRERGRDAVPVGPAGSRHPAGTCDQLLSAQLKLAAALPERSPPGRRRPPSASHLDPGRLVQEPGPGAAACRRWPHAVWTRP